MNPELFFSLARPLSPVYASIMRLREKLYNRNILLKSHRLDKPVISIGNLSMGGTGKTPHVIEIARFLVDNSFRVCVLTRGYGSKAGKGPLLVKDDFRDTSLLGDEPVLIYESVKGVNVVVGSNRVGCARWAQKNLNVDIFLLDDGFQHLALKRDIDIVLLPYDAPFSGGRVFPGGYLREPISALKRANCLILTGSPDFYDKEYLKDEIHEIFPYLPVFLSKKSATKFFNLKGEVFPCKLLEGKDVVGFCGIAKPYNFKSMLLKQGCKIYDFIKFRDHHKYKIKDIMSLFLKFKESNAHFLVTTSKDSVKLRNILRKINSEEVNKTFLEKMLILDIKIDVESGFWQFLENFLRNNPGD